jgi:ribulose-bisphosphate carboxylase large chain
MSHETAAVTSQGRRTSRILRFQPDFSWSGIDRAVYKSDGGMSWQGIVRAELVGAADETKLPFHVRYFEIEPGGYSSREVHEHQHVVIVIRGSGAVALGKEVHSISVGDIVYVAPGEVHQFSNPESSAPFGFYCIVAAERDRPIVLSGDASACEI